jgi:threonine dehydrogenase-like Zn-dependent dehydrogenase
MKAWRFYGFGDMRMDDIPVPPLRRGHVLVQILCVQPSVTEAQLAFGIPTLAYERIRKRLETEAPVQLFGHEFCAKILETGESVTRFAATVWLRARNCLAETARCARRAGTPCAEKVPSSAFSFPAVSANLPCFRRSRL